MASQANTEVDLPSLRDVIARHGLTARRKLGQHFILDANLTDRVVRSAGDLRNVTVFEIGAGPGGLTRSLLRTGARKIIAIERDDRCVSALEELADSFPDTLSILQADALSMDLPAFAPPPRAIVSNLPYNVSVPLLLRWLRTADAFQGITVMVQKEVADRLVAPPGSRTYGRLSVIAQWRFAIRPSFVVEAKAFVPPPKVTSAVVHLEPRDRPEAVPSHALEAVTAAAFGQRRKMLRGSLKGLGLVDDLAALGLDPTMRAENVSVSDYCALARVLADRRERPVSNPTRC